MAITYPDVAQQIWRMTDSHQDNAAATVAIKTACVVLIGGAWVLITGWLLLQLVWAIISFVVDLFDF